MQPKPPRLQNPHAADLPRLKHTAAPEDIAAIRRQQREAFYRCE
jgi:hypothetical protein